MGSLVGQDILGPSGNCKDFGVASMKSWKEMGGRLQIMRPKSSVFTVKIVGQFLNRTVRVMGLMPL